MPTRALIGVAAVLVLASCTESAPTATPPVDDRPATDGLPVPNLSVAYDYVAYVADAPLHFRDPSYPDATIATADNTPPDNPLTNAGATLGRVLFHDVRLSADNTVSCASCHRQESGFADSRRFSVGQGGRTGVRNAMALGNVRYFFGGRMFWDQRAASLEEQALEPITGVGELGMPSVATLESKLSGQLFYRQLFAAAFGDSTVTGSRIASALAQFERSLIPYRSRHDAAMAGALPDDPLAGFRALYDAQEFRGLALFQAVSLQNQIRAGVATSLANQIVTWGCERCHQTSAQLLSVAPGGSLTTRSPRFEAPSGPGALNIGLDPAGSGDPGVLDLGATLDGVRGAFKAPSLRNAEVSAPYMHDGRFATLEHVVAFYADSVIDHPATSRFLRQNDDRFSPIKRFNATTGEIADLVAFIRTLTDRDFLANPMFSNPFVAPN